MLMIVASHVEAATLERCPSFSESSGPFEVGNGAFDEVHADEHVSFEDGLPGVDGEGFELDLETLRKESQRTVGSPEEGVFQEDTVFVLRHEPGR
ncbi:hypothetical protein [Deinococcus yavapaiensis]|uniref:Uncharacterized protein n=1 Tax=Deinococcus yavapaiensis KR-236 TaxID=694435 RepID=A0A318SBS8_9DEIO|nr:hypothetical protein [Deinococcus yavapaiensis]PYE55814.1 hypothetical protein DES52_102179 [Deinococcus yavapaiensis KR-236]